MARTTHRSRSGTKLYAKRSKSGKFTDIQTYKRAHGQDVRRKSAAESTGRKASAKKKVATKKRVATKRRKTATKKKKSSR